MKVVSVLQPWASLIVMGHQNILPRTWSPMYRGELLIHASKAWGAVQNDICCRPPVRELIGRQATYVEVGNATRCIDLPLGKIIGKVNLEDIIDANESSRRMTADKRFKNVLGDAKLPGFYHWIFAQPVLFETFLSANGRLWIWDYKAPEFGQLSAEVA